MSSSTHLKNKPLRHSRVYLFTLALLTGFLTLAAHADETPVACPAACSSPMSDDHFAQMSIQELVDLEVTSASRKSEKLSDVASAIFVLTNDDIRRSGARTIPDALRLVPGVNVGQLDGNQWAVSIRGFNEVFSDKLLVLIDGRSVYTPEFSGVIWPEHDIPLEDIERIEVIRGPGATLWGANAVNGVINIITKSAEKTHGALIAVGGGKEENAYAHLRYGEKVADTDYRVYLKGVINDKNHFEAGGVSGDYWRSYRGGFRSDTKLSADDKLTLQGDVLYSEAGWDAASPDLVSIQRQSSESRQYNTQYLLARWARTFSPESEFVLQGYWDRIDRDDILLQTRRNTWDLDSQYRFAPAKGHDVVVGAEYRVYRDDHDDSFLINIDPDSRTVGLYTGFIQDEITLAPNLLKLIAGVKFERSDLSGAEVLPNVRVVTTPNERNTLWASVSRAVRTPSRFNKNGHLISTVLPSFAGNTPAALSINSNSDFDSEELLAYEVGYRTQPLESVSLDIATFYNNYDKLALLEAGGAPSAKIQDGIPYIEVPTIVTNGNNGKVYGGEVALDVRVSNWWRLVGSYSRFNISVDADSSANDFGIENQESQSSRNQVSLRSQMNLPHQVELDATVRYVSAVQAFDIPDYYAVDAHIGWHVTQDLELSLVGRNLLDNSHIEYASSQVNSVRTNIDRALFARVTYRF